MVLTPKKRWVKHLRYPKNIIVKCHKTEKTWHNENILAKSNIVGNTT